MIFIETLVLTVWAAAAQNPVQAQQVERARELWQRRQTSSALELLRSSQLPEATVLLGDIYFYRGWESENVFPGWHEEPEYREQAAAAYREAAAARPMWPVPHERMGRELLREERAREALAEFDAALQRAPDDPAAQVGRWRALVALGNRDAAQVEIAHAAGASSPESLGAAREGYVLLDQKHEADAIGARILETAPTSPAAAAALADRIDQARAAHRSAEVLDAARTYTTRFPGGARIVDAYDALLEAFQAAPSIGADDVLNAVEMRAKLQSDPAPLLTGANLLIARNAQLDTAIALAARSIPVAERFVEENRGSYKLEDKARGALARSRSSATDTIGWAQFAKKNMAQAEATLLEAERLSRGADATNQFHLGELARARADLEGAREHDLTSLALTGPSPLQAAAKKSLAEVFVRLGNDAAGFDKYVDAELTRRRDARQSDVLRSMLDRPAPGFKVTEVTGSALDLASLHGKVLLLNFFASW